jgi:hypothetical protein
MLVETLRADWTARGTNARVRALPEFDDGALTLGAGTKIAEARGVSRNEAADSERAVALVSVAIGRPLEASTAPTTPTNRACPPATGGRAGNGRAGTGRTAAPRTT